MCAAFLLTVLIAASPYTARVVKVTDGDTITVLTANKQQVKIRLSEIDAPERKQPFSAQSREALASMVFGKDVRVVPHGKDRYGRSIGDIFIDETNVNYELVRLGLAWQYVKYSDSHELAELQREA